MIRKTKILAVITAAAVGIGAAAIYIPAAAEETAEETVSYTYEDLTYEIRYEESGQPYAVITDCDLAATSVEVPAAIDGVLVTTIGEGAFSYCYNLQTITLPYICLALAVSNQALTQKSASPRVTQSSNPKYTFRTWLIRIGLNGEEFKNVRKHLLSHLEGNIAWKNPKDAIAQRERLKQERIAAREQAVAAVSRETA